MASSIVAFICELLILAQVVVSFPAEQQVFTGEEVHADNILKVRAEYVRGFEPVLADIDNEQVKKGRDHPNWYGHAQSSCLPKAPTLTKISILVIDDFVPSMTLNIAWPWKDTSDYNITSQLGNTIKPSRLQHSPNVYVDDDPTITSEGHSRSHTANLTFVLTLSDPDAPSRDDPKWSEMCHWIVATRGPKDVTEIMEYQPPGPPPKTGKHRYVFLAWLPANRTTEELDLMKPKDRQHWGYDPDVDGVAGRVGVRKWAGEMGLMPVGEYLMSRM